MRVCELSILCLDVQEDDAMTAGAATLLQKRWPGFGTGLGRLLGNGREIGGGRKEVRVGLRWDVGCRVKCSLEAGKGRAMCRAVREEVQEVVETGNGPSGAPDSFSDGDPGNEFIGFGAMQENGSMYRERFVVRFSEVGDRGTTSLEMMSSLLQVFARTKTTSPRLHSIVNCYLRITADEFQFFGFLLTVYL